MMELSDEPPKKKLKVYHKCAMCATTIQIISKAVKIDTLKKATEFSQLSKQTFKIGDVICKNCYSRLRKFRSVQNQNEDTNKELPAVQVMEECTCDTTNNPCQSGSGFCKDNILEVSDHEMISDDSSESMEDEPMEPSNEKVHKKTTNSAKCCLCPRWIRNTPGKAEVIETLDDAQQIFNATGYYAQIGDQVCPYCRSIYRKIISNHNKINTREDISSIIPITEESSTINKEDELLSEHIPPCSAEAQMHTQNTQQFSQETSSSFQVESQSSGGSLYVPQIQKEPIEKVDMPFPRPIISHTHCFICKSTEDLQDVPFESRMQVFVSKRIFIPRRNRCCPSHIIKSRFYEDEIPKIKIFSSTCSIEVTEVRKFLDKLSDAMNPQLFDEMGNCGLSEERLKSLTGYTWENILTLKNMMTSTRNSQNRNVTQALITFLMKLRTGNSDNIIAALLNITEKQVNSSIDSILNSFKNDILPKQFGIHSQSRDFFIANTSPVAKKLYNLENNLAIICDGTYLRHGKSSNNTYQRKSYSGQKKTSLCKPFTICTTNGFIVDVAGPFNANKNDAEILKHLIQDPNGLSKILKEDVFFLDRGFRDVKNALEQQGYKVFMPSLKGKKNQLSTEESNESRYVTKIRWVVEAIHGIIGQKNKLLHHQLHNSMLHNATLYCQIACFLQNFFGNRLNSDTDKVDIIIERMREMKNHQNTLANEVEEKNWNRKTLPFKKMSSGDLLDFPEITLSELEIFFTGSYQLKQAISYLAELLKEDDTLELHYATEDTNILKFEVQSRHISRKIYKCYIHYEPDTIGIGGIKRYCCNCANGNRTIGCCSHVAAIIYFLSHARYLSKIIRPIEVLTKLFDCEEIWPVIQEDSEEED